MELSFGRGVDQVSPETRIAEGFARRVVNFDATNDQRLVKRGGVTLKYSGSQAHSCWADPESDQGYFVAAGTLYAYAPDQTPTAIVTGLSPALPISFCEVAGTVYWSNGVQSGRISANVNTDWAPTTTTGPLGQTYLPMVAGTIVRYYRGRIYVVQGSVLWATNAMDYSKVDAARGFMQFEHEITLFEPVVEGCFIGTRGDGVRFLSGHDFNKFDLRNADSQEAVARSGLSVDGAIFDSPGQGAVWFTKRGWVFGDVQGGTKRLTDKTVALPEYESACAIMREQNGMRQVVNFVRGGSESAGASDILTSEVIRNGVLLV